MLTDQLISCSSEKRKWLYMRVQQFLHCALSWSLLIVCLEVKELRCWCEFVTMESFSFVPSVVSQQHLWCIPVFSCACFRGIKITQRNMYTIGYFTLFMGSPNKKWNNSISTSAESGIQGAIVVAQISAIARVGVALKRAFLFLLLGLGACGGCQALCRLVQGWCSEGKRDCRASMSCCLGGRG